MEYDILSVQKTPRVTEKVLRRNSSAYIYSEDRRGILDLTAQTVKHKKTFTFFKEVISHDKHDKEITETESQERLHTR